VLDSFDLHLLALYQHDVRRTAESLGATVGLSAAAVQRRLRRLRDSGVIQGEVALIDAALVGLPVTTVVNVDLEIVREAQISAFKERMSKHPAVQQCMSVTGDCDFILVVVTPTMGDYERFHHVFLNDPNVKSFKTYVVLHHVKSGFALPIPFKPSQLGISPC